MAVLSVLPGGGVSLTRDQQILLFERIYDRICCELLPAFTVKRKADVRVHRVINKLFNCVWPDSQKDAYLLRYSTTFNQTAALSQACEASPGVFYHWNTLCHEANHALQALKKKFFWFSWLYLWPLSQGLLLLSLVWLPLLWSSWPYVMIWIGSWSVLSLAHFIPQLPDPGRTRFELESYLITMHLEYLAHGKLSLEYVNSIAEQFYSMAYYIMEPRKDRICHQLRTAAIAITRGQSPVKDNPIVKIAEEEYYRVTACPKTRSSGLG